MKNLLLLSISTFLTSLILSALALAAPRYSETLKFKYVSSDGSVYLDCVYVPLQTENEFYRVTCGKAPTVTKVFDVRFRVRPLRGPQNPVFEIAMWVTDRNADKKYDQGSTIWIRLTEGLVTDVTLHQEVENSYAALVAYYTLRM